MAEFKGRDFLLKIGDSASSETFATVAGMRTTRMRVANELVDVSNATDGRFRKLLGQAGLTSFSLSGSGVFQDDAAVATFQAHCFDGTLVNCQVVFGNGQIVEGLFQIESIEFNGEHNGAQMFDMTMESSGAPTVTT